MGRRQILVLCVALMAGLSLYSGTLVWNPSGTPPISGGSGYWTNSTAWWNGVSHGSWVAGSDAVFSGNAGNVKLANANTSIGQFKVESDGYTFDVAFFDNKRTYTIGEFVGSANMCITNSGAADRRDGLVFKTMSGRLTYSGDLASHPSERGRQFVFRIDGGTIEFNRNAPYNSSTPWYTFYVMSGTSLWNTVYMPTYRQYIGEKADTGTKSVVGGIGSKGSVNAFTDTTFWQFYAGATLSPGDPLVNNGVGTLDLNNMIWFDTTTQVVKRCRFVVDLADATNNYDRVIISGNNTRVLYPVNFTNSNPVNAYGTWFVPRFAPTFDGGSPGDFICLIDNRATSSGSGHHKIAGEMENAPHNGELVFTNTLKTVYTFAYKYNVDKDAPASSGNDFGLLITKIELPKKGTLVVVR